MTTRRLRWAGPAAAVVVAVAGAALLAGRDPSSPAAGSAGSAAGPDGSAAGPPPTEAPPVAVTSDAPRFTRLADLVAAADLVVAGEVASTERGRTFGSPGGAAIVSRLVTLRVDEVLAGTPPAEGAPGVLVEEEGWLDDGRPLAVDGAAPSEVGDRGVWFLVDAGDPELPVYTVVNAEGRYLVDDAGTLVGAAGDDPLVAAVEAMTPESLAAEVAAHAR